MINKEKETMKNVINKDQEKEIKRLSKLVMDLESQLQKSEDEKSMLNRSLSHKSEELILYQNTLLTKQQLDEFFETNDYTKLLNE